MLRAIGLPETPPIQGQEPTTADRRSTTSSFLQELARAFSRATAGSSMALHDLSVSPLANGSAPNPIGSRPPGSLQSLIIAAARQEHLPPALLAAVVQVESGFQPRAVSPAGAKGLTQLMDDTARALGVTDPFDPWQSLMGGARYLRAMLDRYSGDVSLALAAYNAGPNAVDAAGRTIPPYTETRAYVRKVFAAYCRQSTAAFPLGGDP